QAETQDGGGDASQAEAQRLLEDLRRAGRLEEAREQLAVRNAIDLIVETAKPIPLEQAKARERIWTPEKAAAGGGEPGGGPGGGGARPPGGSPAAPSTAPGGGQSPSGGGAPSRRLWTPGGRGPATG
ncbi:MAG: hypothetical protein KGJ43_04625, partial [Acidobacteriota bacterium]|nr:hypothetical protein [Acidobacteriota bacterium]